MALQIRFNSNIDKSLYPEASMTSTNSIVIDSDSDKVLMGDEVGQICVYMGNDRKVYNHVAYVQPYYYNEG